MGQESLVSSVGLEHQGENGLEFLCGKAQSFYHQLLKGKEPETSQAKIRDQTLGVRKQI